LTKPLALTLCLLVSLYGCQKSEQSSIQPEKLASSSPSSDGAAVPHTSAETSPGASAEASATTAAGDVPGPLIPYAKGKAPPKPTGKKPTKKKTAPAPVVKRLPEFTDGEVKLLDAGAEPRRKLRLKTKVGHTEKMQMTMQMGVGIEVAGRKQPSAALPPMVMAMDMKVTEAKPSGDIRYDFVLKKTAVPEAKGVNPKVAKVMEAGLAKLVGMKGFVVVSDRGLTRQAKFDMPGKTGPEIQQVMQGMEQAMNQMSSPLPVEDVGVGAKWLFGTHMSQNGVTLSQVATYTLTKLEGDQLTLGVKLEQTAPRQKVASPIGVTVDLLSLASTGKGKTRARLDRLTPLKSLLHIDSAVNMAVPVKKQVQSMKMTTSMSILVESPKK
jgi:hypothetical protein